jgi:hypothetical protein
MINGCTPAAENGTAQPSTDTEGTPYGRTEKEKERDKKLKADTFFNEHELATIAVLCGLILPANDSYGSATDAGVPDFIEFIAKDMPHHQLPLRGGLMWLDNRSNKLFNKEFKKCSAQEQKSMLDEIAYPEKASPEVEQGVRFFTHLRNLTLTGYYTSEMGIKDLGYKGNTPNVWDGVPEDVLKEHGMAYDEEWLKKCMDPETRNDVAQWDDEGNLIS